MTPMNAPDEQVLRFKTWVTAIVIGCLLLYVFFTNLNLMLGFEHQYSATVSVEIKPGSKPRHRHLYRTSTGEEFARTVRASDSNRVGVKHDSEVTIVTDGLFWTEVVAVDSGQGLKRY